MGAVSEQDVCQPVLSAQRGDKRLKNHDGKRTAGVERLPAPTLCDEEGLPKCWHLPTFRQGVGTSSHASAPQETLGFPRQSICHAGARAAPGSCEAGRWASEAQK